MARRKCTSNLHIILLRMNGNQFFLKLHIIMSKQVSARTNLTTGTWTKFHNGKPDDLIMLINCYNKYGENIKHWKDPGVRIYLNIRNCDLMVSQFH